MVPTLPAAHLSQFSALGDSSFLYEPSTQKNTRLAPTANPQHPDTIILCTWPGAKQHQLSRYTTGYARLFPTSRILLITSTSDSLPSRPATPRSSFDIESAAPTPASSPISGSFPTTNLATKEHPLSAAATSLLPSSYPVPISRNLVFHPSRRRTMISTSRRGVLLHLFSTPGALQACALARAYRSIFAGRALDVQAVIFDSIPVFPRRDTSAMFREGVTAGVVSMVNDVWSWICGALEHAGANIADDFEHSDVAVAATAEALARDLNDRSLLRQGARHCYVYPERNVIESWKASASGSVERMDWYVIREQVDVQKEDGEMTVDERRYWGAIEELWID